MNLKEAFRFQNKLGSLTDQAAAILSQEANLVRTKTITLRSRAAADAEDETVESLSDNEFAQHINHVADFLIFLLGERESLSNAVRQAKNALPIDMDSEIVLNTQRQRLGKLFRNMASLRSTDTLVSGGGVGYRFNAEGNQVPYRCDVRRVTTIHFDRNKIRRLADRMSTSADTVSTEVDRCLINQVVAYTPPFGVNESFEDILRDFIART